MPAGRVEPGGIKSGWIGLTSSLGGFDAGLRELVFFYFSAWLGNLRLSLLLWFSCADTARSSLPHGIATLGHHATSPSSAMANARCRNLWGFLVVGGCLVSELSGARDGHSMLCPLSWRG
eukprot:1895318-Amphidinium_carterae.1